MGLHLLLCLFPKLPCVVPLPWLAVLLFFVVSLVVPELSCVCPHLLPCLLPKLPCVVLWHIAFCSVSVVPELSFVCAHLLLPKLACVVLWHKGSSFPYLIYAYIYIYI